MCSYFWQDNDFTSCCIQPPWKLTFMTCLPVTSHNCKCLGKFKRHSDCVQHIYESERIYGNHLRFITVILEQFWSTPSFQSSKKLFKKSIQPSIMLSSYIAQCSIVFRETSEIVSFDANDMTDHMEEFPRSSQTILLSFQRAGLLAICKRAFKQKECEPFHFRWYTFSTTIIKALNTILHCRHFTNPF